MVQGFGGQARFVVENHGQSELAKRFGVTRYPAIFVDDILAATPNDFGFYGPAKGVPGGRYAPIKSAQSHERFRADLTRMIDLVLAGRKDTARAEAAPAETQAASTLPAFTITDLDGKTITRADLAGRPVLVEVWATWCVPCRPGLTWLGEVKKKYGDKLAVVAIAVESPEEEVRKQVGELNLPFIWTMGDPELVRSFGDVSAVPTLFLYDAEGRAVATFFGAPPSLHQEVEAKVAALF